MVDAVKAHNFYTNSFYFIAIMNVFISLLSLTVAAIIITENIK